MSWITLSGQTGTPKDTTRCYGITELARIAAGLVNGKTCNDTLLPIAKAQLAQKDSIIKENKIQNNILSIQLSLKESIIKDKDVKIEALDLHISSLETKNKWLKFGWLGSTIAIVTTFVYLSFR